MATSSPKATWQVGCPRRSSSSSIAGRSSWISEYVWIISMAAAIGRTSSGSRPSASAVASASTGRMRFPPASSE
jgi:hypothetical protein